MAEEKKKGFDHLCGKKVHAVFTDGTVLEGILIAFNNLYHPQSYLLQMDKNEMIFGKDTVKSVCEI